MAELKINRGTTYVITFKFLKDGQPSSLVGATVRFTIKSTEYDDSTNDATAVVKKNITGGTSAGIATITLDPEDTATLTPKIYYYDIKVEDSVGAVYKCDEGKVKLDGSPTNRLT